jgi:hypothetical protein
MLCSHKQQCKLQLLLGHRGPVLRPGASGPRGLKPKYYSLIHTAVDVKYYCRGCGATGAGVRAERKLLMFSELCLLYYTSGCRPCIGSGG